MLSELVCEGIRFGEGPVWCGDDTLVVTSVADGALSRIRVATGAIDTDAFRAYGGAFVEEATRTAPLGRIASPEEVASVIAFLSSPGGAYITGTTVVVDGGNDAWGLGFPPPQPGQS